MLHVFLHQVLTKADISKKLVALEAHQMERRKKLTTATSRGRLAVLPPISGGNNLGRSASAPMLSRAAKKGLTAKFGQVGANVVRFHEDPAQAIVTLNKKIKRLATCLN